MALGPRSEEKEAADTGTCCKMLSSTVRREQAITFICETSFPLGVFSLKMASVVMTVLTSEENLEDNNIN